MVKKGDKIRVRSVQSIDCCTSDDDSLTLGVIYDAIFNGIGSANNPMYCELVDDDGWVWSGQLDGKCGFRLLIESK